MKPRANVLSGLGIERCSDARDDLEWIRRRLDDPNAAFVPVFRSQNLIEVATDSIRLRLLRVNDLPAPAPPVEEAIFLGTLGKRPLFALGIDEAQARLLADDGRKFKDLRWLVPLLDGEDAAVGAYARAICYWHYRHRYCGICGAPNASRSGGFRLRCSGCGKDQFPRVDPAIIVAVGHGDRLLLGRQAAWDRGRYSTLAGFVEPGEALEDAVVREVNEEAGVSVVRCEYHSSQPWPFPSSLMLGFLAEAGDDAIRVGAELEDARWFEADDIRTGLRSGDLRLPPHASISFRLIEHWLKRRAGVELSQWKTDKGW